jgi:hypothetical protein
MGALEEADLVRDICGGDVTDQGVAVGAQG